MRLYLDANVIGDGTTVQRQGYIFVYTRPSAMAYTVTANPEQHGLTGGRHFFTDETGSIRLTFEDRDATSSDPPLS